MWWERIAVGIAASLCAAFVPGMAPTCLERTWELPTNRLRRRAAAGGALGARVASATAGRAGS